MKWLMTIIGIIVIAVVFLVVVAVVVSFIQALYQKIRYHQPFFASWWQAFKSFLGDSLFEILFPWNWF